jgi:hypothetical protein
VFIFFMCQIEALFMGKWVVSGMQGLCGKIHTISPGPVWGKWMLTLVEFDLWYESHKVVKG